MHPSGPCRTQLSPDLWPCSEVIRLRTLQRRVRERLLFPEVKGNSLVIFCYLICGGYLICCSFFIINLSACPPTHCSFYLTRQMDVDGLSLRYINCNHNSALTNEQMNASNKDLRTNNLKDRKQSDTRRPYIWIIGDLPQLTDFRVSRRPMLKFSWLQRRLVGRGEVVRKGQELPEATLRGPEHAAVNVLQDGFTPSKQKHQLSATSSKLDIQQLAHIYIHTNTHCLSFSLSLCPLTIASRWVGTWFEVNLV